MKNIIIFSISPRPAAIKNIIIFLYQMKKKRANEQKRQKTAGRDATAAVYSAGRECAHMRMLAVFEKGERIRHIGHLDIQRSVQRGLRRSGLPVAYSNGFNPHILITFASALLTSLPDDYLDFSLLQN